MSALENAIKKVDMNLMLNILGEEYVKWLKKLIKDARKVASGKLMRSIDYKVVKQAEKYLLKISAADYLKYVDAGRAPGKMPPVNKIIKWTKQRGIQFSGLSQKQTGWVIAMSIKKKGIKPTNIIDNAKKQVIVKTKSLRLSDKDKQIILDEIARDLASFSNSQITIKK